MASKEGALKLTDLMPPAEKSSAAAASKPTESAESLRLLTIPQLKEKCQLRLLKVSGTKEELVARITGAPPPPKKEKAPKKVPGVADEDLLLLDHDKLKKDFLSLTKSLAHTVDRDWHDSYEETDEALGEYVSDLAPHLLAVLRCCASPQAGTAALARCNLVMGEIAESWRKLSGVPFRCCMDESTADVKIDLSEGLPEGAEGAEDEDEAMKPSALSRGAAVAATWAALAQAAATRLPSEEEETLKRLLKDAGDYGVREEQLRGGHGPWRSAAGVARVEALLNSGALQGMPSRLGPIKRYRAIDRRFDGPKHLRTRDYDSGSEGGGCAQQ